jgi:hypothetical protein
MKTHVRFVHVTLEKARLCLSNGGISIILDNYVPLYPEGTSPDDGALVRLKVAVPEDVFMRYEDGGTKERIHVGPRDGTQFRNQYAVVRVTDAIPFPIDDDARERAEAALPLPKKVAAQP